MSIANCDRCGAYVDTDADVECYFPVDRLNWECVCESCRDAADVSEDYRLDDPRHEPYSNLRR